MMKRLMAAFLFFGLVNNGFAFTCFLTLVKANCWQDYDVKIELIDAGTKKLIVSGDVPKGKLWSRQQYECTAGTSFNYSATFTPAVWENQKDKVYYGKRTWSLPAKIAKGKTAWNVTICFPEVFAEVPQPITEGQHCACSMQGIPPVIPPQKP